MGTDEDRTVWVGNLHEKVEEDILFELFLQAGPLQYVKLPKDKVTGRKKNFAFICYRHECSVPYAIDLMNDIRLYGRNIRVQSKHLQELQAQGLVPYGPGGVHTLSPFEQDTPTPSHHQQVPQMMQTKSLLGDVPPHILALAQQQMAMLNANQPMPLALNPLLNSPKRPRDDRNGSIHYGRNSPSYSAYEHRRYDRYPDNRDKGPRSVDNITMQAMKSRFEGDMAQNSQMLTALQDRQGRFDRSRLGPSVNSHDSRYHHDRDGYNRPQNRDHRQQPYSRHDSHHSRNHERHSSHDSYRRHDDRQIGYRNKDNYNRGHRNSYDSRR